jgi:hypothetical protein
MSEATEALDLDTPDVPASGEVETSSRPTDIDSSDLEQEEGGETTSTEDDLDDLEFDGETYRIPKKLKSGFMMQSDYTRKTQEVAQTRQELEAERARVAQQAQATESLTENRKKLILAEATVEKYAKIDWAKLEAEDPFKAQTLWREQSQWTDYAGKLKAHVEKDQATLSEAATSEKNKRLNETFQAIPKAIPGWNGDLAKKLEAFGQTSLGMTTKQLDKGIEKVGAPFVLALHKAYLADQLIQKQQQAAKTTTAPQETVKPLATISRGKAPASRKSLADMSMDEYAAARKAGRTT